MLDIFLFDLMFFLSYLDEIDESRCVLGRRWRPPVAGDPIAPLLLLVESDEGCGADRIGLEQLDAPLRRVDGVHDEAVESRAGGRDGHVVLVVDGAQVAQASVEAAEATLGAHLLEEADALVLVAAGGHARLRLGELLTRALSAFGVCALAAHRALEIAARTRPFRLQLGQTSLGLLPIFNFNLQTTKNFVIVVGK